MESVVLSEDYSKTNTPKTLGYGFNYAYRRDTWKKVRFPDRDHGEDSEFVQSILASGGHLHQFADTAGICVHVLHKENISLCYPQYRLPPFFIAKLLLPAWAIEMLRGTPTE